MDKSNREYQNCQMNGRYSYLTKQNKISDPFCYRLLIKLMHINSIIVLLFLITYELYF